MFFLHRLLFHTDRGQLYQRAAVAACAACRVAATPYVYASNSMERHFAALSPRRCNKRSGRRTRSSPAPGPGWCGRAAGPPRRGRSGVGQSQRLSDGHPSRVREPRVTTIGDRKDRRHGLRWVQRSVRGADGGTAPREPAMADAAYADSGPRGSAATGPVPTGPGMSRARACAAIRSEDGAMHHHLHHHHSVLDGAVYSTKGSKALRSS